MHAAAVLQKCLKSAFGSMHALRQRVLMRAVDALLHSRRLTLMDLARAWPDAERVRAPLKALDRLLRNPHLHAERELLYGGMAQWLLRRAHPVIIVDWSPLKADLSWHVLRAAVPVGGRTLPVLDLVFPGAEQGAPQVERRFLQRLKALLPPDARPIIVTDAGFRAPWFRAVAELGWDWVGRLRHRTLVQVPGHPDLWAPARALYALATATPRDLGVMQLVWRQPLASRVVLYAKPAQGRHRLNRAGQPARSKASQQSAAREREPWLVVAAPTLADMSARQLVQIYALRMQIEASFRDLKSHRFGYAFEDSLTRKAKRLEILLLVHALALFVSWLAGLACAATGLDQWLAPIRSRRKLYSILRVGREALVRRWPIGRVAELIERLRDPKAAWHQLAELT